METIFIKIFNMSISASWLVLAIIILRAALKKAPKWIRCILWGLVGIRLLCPFSFESMLSLIPSAEVVPQDILYAESPGIQSGVTAVNRFVNPIISNSLTPTVGDSVNTLQIVIFLAAVVWVLGMIALVIYAGISYLRIQRKVAVSMRAEDNVYVCDYIDTPFILGVIKPRIYIPSSLIEDEKRAYVIAHEKAHLKRHDHWWKPLGYLLLTVYWFNPVIWLAYVLLCRDIELACDEYVISRLEESDKKSYSHALLSCSIPRRMIAACPLAFGEVGVKDRVKAILNYKKPAFWIIVVSVIACIAVAVCFLTNPKEKLLHAPEPFCHTYRVDEIIYSDFRYSFAYTTDTAPRYQFTSDYAMFVSGDLLDGPEGFEWIQQYGKFEEVKLSPSNFDNYFFNDRAGGPTSVLGPDDIRKNAEKAWRIDIMDDENGVFYYFILSKHGEVYLTYGYDVGDSHAAKEDSSLIRWVFKLARTDILTCNAVSEGCNAFIEPVYYPEGFDWNYEELTEGVVNESGKLIFSADWDVDSLTVSEDYYNNFHSENKSGGTTIEKETYTLQRNAKGNFELDVAIRSQNGDMAVYFIQGPVGVYVMKITFADDEAAFTVASEEVAPPVDSEYLLNNAITDAILNRDSGTASDGLFHCASFVLLGQETVPDAVKEESGEAATELVTVYGLALKQSYGYSGGTFHEQGGSHIPTAITFEVKGDEYILKEYWIPRDGNLYEQDIRDKFPDEIEEDAMDTQKYILGQIQNCYEQAVAYGEVDTDSVVEGLLEQITESPGTLASGVQDYIDAHSLEYRELTYYGKYTLWYCFKEFLEGEQTDLRGHIMASVCEEISLGWGEALLIDGEVATGQDWFEEFRSNAEGLQKQYSETEMQKLYPASWLLLQVIQLQSLHE